MVIVVMGPAGAGKTTVGRQLAAALGWPFDDADDYHTPAHRQRMRDGLPLTDADRRPWLETLRDLIAGRLARGECAVLACSALRQTYRDALVPDPVPPGAVVFVYLKVPQPVLVERLARRRDHFASTALLASQLQALEEPTDGATVDGTAPVGQIVATVRRQLGL